MSDATTIRTSPSLDERLFDIETKVIVRLYEVAAAGYRVECDKWIENRLDHWKEDHGLYARHVLATWKRDELVEKFISQEYQLDPRVQEYPREGKSRFLLVKGDREMLIQLQTINANPTDLSLGGLGECTYKGRKVIL